MKRMKYSGILKKERNMTSMERTGNMQTSSNRQGSSGNGVPNILKHFQEILEKVISPIFSNHFSVEHDQVQGSSQGSEARIIMLNSTLN